MSLHDWEFPRLTTDYDIHFVFTQRIQAYITDWGNASHMFTIINQDGSRRYGFMLSEGLTMIRSRCVLTIQRYNAVINLFKVDMHVTQNGVGFNFYATKSKDMRV